MTNQPRAKYVSPLLEDLLLRQRMRHLLSELSFESDEDTNTTIGIIEDQGEL